MPVDGDIVEVEVGLQAIAEFVLRLDLRDDMPYADLSLVLAHVVPGLGGHELVGECAVELDLGLLSHDSRLDRRIVQDLNHLSILPLGS